MAQETITLTYALTELKLLSKRITKQLNTIKPVVVKKGNKFDASIKSQEEYEKNVKAEWQSLNDLMARRRKIKTALVMANAVTKVEIAGETMTIAEAIERKNMLDMEETIIKEMRSKLVRAQRQADKHNEEVKENLMTLLEATYGQKTGQLSKEAYDRVGTPFMENNEAKLIDPLNCDKIMKKMEEKSEKFYGEVDVCLSIANAKTEITI